MRTVGGFVLGLLPVLVLLMAIVAADDTKSCFNASGSDVVFKGDCTSASVATIELGAKAFLAVIDYQPAKEIDKTTLFNLKIAGCEFKKSKIQNDDPGSGETAAFFLGSAGYYFPVTATVSESAVEIKDKDNQVKEICSSPQFADLEGGKFASNVSIDLKGTAVSPLSITIKDAKLQAVASDSEKSIVWIIVAIVGGVIGVLAVIASVVGGIVYYCKCRKPKKGDKKPDGGKELTSTEISAMQKARQGESICSVINEDLKSQSKGQSATSMPFVPSTTPFPTAKTPAKSNTPTGRPKDRATSQAEQAVGVQLVTAVDDAGAAQQTGQAAEVQAAEPVKPEVPPHPVSGLRQSCNAVKDQRVTDKDIEALNEALDQVVKVNKRTTWDKSLSAFFYACSTRVSVQ